MISISGTARKKEGASEEPDFWDGFALSWIPYILWTEWVLQKKQNLKNNLILTVHLRDLIKKMP